VLSIRYMTHVMLFVLAVDAALYSVSYAYLLHQVVNFFCAWLVLIHLSTSSFSFYRLDRLLDDSVEPDGQHMKKRP
jgi:glycosylphosphatidylinositol deacylase